MELLVRRAPDNAGHWSRLASFYHLQGQGTAAEQAYGQAIALDPRLENAYHGLRELRIGADDLDGALEIARRQQENCGATDELVLAIGHIRRRQGELADALAIFRAIPAASELKEPALQAEAGTACELGLFDDALAAAERLCERYPHSAASPLIRANVLCAARRFEEAVPLLQELVDRDADNPELHRLYSGVLARPAAIRNR